MNASKDWLLACNFDSASELQSTCPHLKGFHPTMSANAS